MSILSVSQLNRYAKLLIEGTSSLANVYVLGEIFDYRVYRSGHAFFELKDENSSVRAVMFSGLLKAVRFQPTDGMRVLVCGKATLYEGQGQFQIQVSSMQPYGDGVGALSLAYEKLKNKLEKEGLFDEAHKKPLPKFPHKIGVITSETGAVINDIRNVVSRRYPMAEILLCPVTVQGAAAAAQLTSAVRYVGARDDIDVIIIGRGGGSSEDLSCFNDEALVRAIYACLVPIISAVGHERDYTLCDFVSDCRAPTPSAAAELAVPDRTQLLRSVQDNLDNIRYAVYSKLRDEQQSIDILAEKLELINLPLRIDNEKSILHSMGTRIHDTLQRRIDEQRADVTALADRVEYLSPLNVIKRGYAMVEKDGEPVRSTSQLFWGDSVKLIMSDGEAVCTVTELY